MKRNLSKNLVFSFISLFSSIAQSIWFVPFIIKNLGTEIYGYTSVIIGFINISLILSIAITSMSSRYIVVELKKNNLEKAKCYFNSILFSLIFIVIILFIIFSFFIINIQLIMNVDEIYKFDVQILFSLSVISLLISIINTPFLSALYYTEKLYLIYIITTINYMFKIGVPLIALFSSKMHVWDMALGGVIVDIFSLIFYYKIYKKYLPKVKIDISFCNKRDIKEVVGSGIWVTITKTGNILLSNINTYLSNILLNAFITGVYSAVLQLQSLVIVMSNTIINCFVPRIYSLFNEDNNLNMIKLIKKILLILGIPLGIVSGEIIVFGKYFMSFWIDEYFLDYSTLIALVIFSLPFYIPAEIFNQINITYKKNIVPAIITIIFGIINLCLILFFNRVFNIGIYSIVLSQLCLNILRGFIFFPLYTCKILCISYRNFIYELFIAPIIMIITCLIGIFVAKMYNLSQFLDFISACFITMIISILITSSLLLMRKQYRCILRDFLRRQIVILSATHKKSL